MRISLIVNNFIPELGSAADLFFQIAKGLKNKHKLSVITFEPRSYRMGKLSLKEYNNKINLKIIKKSLNIEIVEDKIIVYRIKHLQYIYRKYGNTPLFSKFEHIIYPFLFIPMIKYFKNSDVLLVYSPPLLLGFIMTVIAKLLRVKIIINLQDIHPQAAIDLGLLKNKLLFYLLIIIEKMMYDLSDIITVHSEGNKKYLHKRKTISLNKIHTIYNVCEIPSIKSLENSNFKEKNKLLNKFLVTYAGTMSYSQDLETIIYAAHILRNNKDIYFILAGEGPQKRTLINLKKELNIKNLNILPYQIGWNYWNLIISSDVCLVSLKKSKVSTPVVPRKLQDIMASATPVIANVPLNGDVPKIIALAKCGMSVESENPKKLAQAILYFVKMDKVKRKEIGYKGRAYAKQNFATKKIIDQYNDILTKLKG